jgi:hypothetical protein
VSGELRIPRWGDGYPDPSVIRHEVEAMVAAVTGALAHALGDNLRGLWLKGSVTRRWESPLDYVPELSDVDFHFSLAAAIGLTTDQVLELHADIDRRFSDSVPDPLHIPRPQFLAIEAVQSIPGYRPAPMAAVRTLLGPVPDAPSDDVDREEIKRAEATRLVDSGDPNVIASAGLGLLENPGRHLFRTLRALSWYVSPVGGRVLCTKDGDFDRAWSANRTTIVASLVEVGEVDLAERIVAYYTAAWRFFLSGWRDADAGRAAFRAAITMLELGAEIGRRTLSEAESVPTS